FLILIPVLLWSSLAIAGDEHGAASQQDDHGAATAAETHDTEAGHDEHGVASPGEADAHAAAGEHGGEQAGEHEAGGVLGLLTHHLMDTQHYQFLFMDFHLPTLTIGGFELPITKHTIMLITAAILLIVLLMPLKGAMRKGDGIPHGFANFMEVLIVFMRDEVIYPNMGEKYGKRYLGYFLTIFFFVLFSNLLGMIPWGSSSTGNIAVTGALAVFSLLVMILSGMVIHGPFKYMASFVPHGIPAFVIPILFPIEIAGVVVKHFALCIRLFANMLAGHAVITVFLGLIGSWFIAPIAIVGAVAISLLELFVAFLQAYIFVMLSSLFIGSAVHGEH
ncbi:F0F1 ATP synthase subunit A, partial [bacterium]|nr:F0F1 ATP synthase subunit A [bacterium]